MDHRASALCTRAVLASFLLFGTSGCLAFGKEQGVKNTWRAGAVTLEVGTTTQAEVARQLGPPSQIIGLEGQTVFYYVRERSSGRGLILFVYNHIQQSIKYDRAVFFFDDQGELTSYSFSEEILPVEGDD